MALLICKSVVFLTSVAIMIWIVAQGVLMRRAKHSLRSWSVGFYALCFIWLMFRSVFWGLTIVTSRSWNPTTFYILYWTPNPIQFGAFLLLPLFFAQITHRKTWRDGWKYIKPLYVMFTVGASIFFVFWSVLAATRDRRVSLLCDLRDNEEIPHTLPTTLHSLGLVQPTMGLSIDQRPPLSGSRGSSDWDGSGDYGEDDAFGSGTPYSAGFVECYQAQFINAVFRGVSGVCFFVLAGAMAYFSVIMRRMRSWQYASTAALRLTPQELAFTNVSLFAIFFCRGLYQAGSAFHLWYLPEVPLHRDADISPALLFVFLAWDVLPTLLILVAVQARSPTKFSYLSTASFAQGAYSAALKEALEDSVAAKQKKHAQGQRGSKLPDYGVFGRLKEDLASPDEAASKASVRRERMIRLKRDAKLSAAAHGRGDVARDKLGADDSAYDSSCTDPEISAVAARLAQGRLGHEDLPSPEKRSRKKRRGNRYIPHRGYPTEEDRRQFRAGRVGNRDSWRSTHAHSPSSTDSSSSFFSSRHRAPRARGPPRTLGAKGRLSSEEIGSWQDEQHGRALASRVRPLGEESVMLPHVYQTYGSIDEVPGEEQLPSNANSHLCDLAAAERSYTLALAEQQERQRGLMHGVPQADLV
mmetsp:Transcript_19309/g.72963  ORF Transcript_19309/g.72963 Transcript_19309/m.72963 type:complete len:639 (-) Transcript_19309:228-2144(-)